MNETLLKMTRKLKTYWQNRKKGQKIILVASIVFLITITSLIVFLTTKTTLVPLYSNLSPSETGSIKENLDGRGIQSEITDGGTTIKVPEQMMDSLKVELAAQGIPKSGNIDYSFFGKNAGLGMTDNEFNVLKLDAMQTELADLIKGIEGVNDAQVMINIPEKGIFVSDVEEKASASIVLNTKSGYQFENSQIKALYHLISKSIPNLPTDNIVIMNQYFEYFDLENSENSSSNLFAAQTNMKKQVERDIQRQVQNMLGTLMGQDKVIVSVSADIDFTKENREENLVTPVDEENMQGIAISAQKITEAYTGNGEQTGGVPQGEDPADSLGSSYVQGNNSNGDYEKLDDKINYEVNRVRKEIEESPYKIRDLGIQVMVEPPEPDNPSSLPQDRVNDINQILATIIRTTIDKNETNQQITDEDLQNKVVVSVQPFNGKIKMNEEPKALIPWWIYVIGVILLAIIALFIFLFLRSRKKLKGEDPYQEIETFKIPDEKIELETESTLQRKQIEKMAKEDPEEFARLLRTWIADE
ncbi:flagellar basal-body MS-ring/collar protein FliF [Bacillus sp. 03113]|uniref:flagellar basal-body MS-ring/collar protein FliF n=1 Tax=Bacillus sp. 03113 TaxID=2578211 RepID=UPI0011437122|nr:flagellar basal-body MS-ring/collar protein FliF [Bacillus sp. 03113]